MDEPSLYEIISALYTINQRIKQLRVQKALQRDLARYEQGKASTVTFRKAQAQFGKRINTLYHLKSTSFHKLRDVFGISPVGYHTTNAGVKCDFYRVGRFSFHLDECTSENNLGQMQEIDKDFYSAVLISRFDKGESNVKIPSKQRIKDPEDLKKMVTPLQDDLTVKMTFSKAFKLLKRFTDMKDIEFK